MFKMLLCAFAPVLFCRAKIRADDLTWFVNLTFHDGGTVTGSFHFNPLHSAHYHVHVNC